MLIDNVSNELMIVIIKEQLWLYSIKRNNGYKEMDLAKKKKGYREMDK